VGHYCIHQAYIALLKRLQVLNQILFLLIGKPEIETGIVAVNDIQECLEAAIVIEAAFILREHKEPPVALMAATISELRKESHVVR
jgi:hypothetical protein